MAIVNIDPTKAGTLPEGEYNAYISEYKQKTSEKGNTYYNIEFTLHGNDQYDGRKVFQNYGLETSFFLQLLTAIGFDYPNQEFQFDDKFLGGKPCRIKVFHEEYTDSSGKKKMSSKVSDVMPGGSNPVQSDTSNDDSDEYIDTENMPF